MNGKIIFLLSLFGLAMAFATVYFIPSNVEPFCWLVIFLICAYVLASRTTGKYFASGVCIGLLNSVWITAIHILLYSTYMANHPKEMQAMTKMPLPDHPQVMMLIMGRS